MPPFTLKIVDAGLQATLKSAGVQAELRRRAQAIASAAAREANLPEDSFVVDLDVGKTRARAVVVTASAEAMVAEATDRVLTRSFDAGRG